MNGAPAASAPETTTAVDAWAVIPEAAARLRRGGPDQLRVLIARSLGALGLREPAEAWTDTIPGTPELTPMIEGLREGLAELPCSRVEPAARIAAARSALGARDDLGAQLDPHFDRWVRREPARRWHRANDSKLIETDPALHADHPDAVARLDPAPGLPPTPTINVPSASGPPPPVVLFGMRNAQALIELESRLPRLSNGAWAGILVVEPDPDAVLDVVADERIADILKQDRLRFFVGPDAEDRAAADLEARRQTWESLVVLPAPGRDEASFRARIERITRERNERFLSLRAANNARYAGRDRAWWAERFRAARAGEAPPLRPLVMTTRFSTYIQHSSRDICDAFRSLGMEPTLLIEPDDSASHDGLALAEAVAECEPDLFVIINYTREGFVSAMPSNIPHVCWIQDAMPHLFSEKTARDVDDLTIVVGNVFTELVTEHGYPAKRCLRFPVPASETKFLAEINDNPGCDMLVATNHGESPEQFRDRLESECVASGGRPGLILDTHEQIAGSLDSWTSSHLRWWLDDILRPVRQKHRVEPGSEAEESLMRDAAIPMVNRILRHRMIGWAADLADERGWTLRIAGRGWDGHPRFGKYSIGEVPHGPALRDLYNDARVTLHTSASWLFHQRLFECSLAGGLPAVMIKPDDLTAILRPARALTMLETEPTCTRLEDRRLCVQTWDHPLFARSIALAQRIFGPQDTTKPPRDDAERAMRTGWIPWRTGTADSPPVVPEAQTPEEQLGYLEALSGMMFFEERGLAEVVEHCRAEPEWRRTFVKQNRTTVRSAFTNRAVCEAMNEALSQQLQAG